MHRTIEATTINGSVVNNVAASKNGLPILGDRMNFVTVSKSGRVKDKTRDKVSTQYANEHNTTQL